MKIDYTYKRLENHGRLGNQLWQIASVTGIAARDENAKPAFKPNWQYRKFFNVPDEFFSVPNKNARDFSIPNNGYVDYMQRYREFSEIADEVRNMFSPSELGVQGVVERWPHLYGHGKKIALHVRRGDYIKHAHLFPAPTMDYYRQGLNLALQELGVEKGMSEEEAAKEAKILVFSDDIPWCKTVFSEHFEFIEGVPRAVEVRERVGDPEDQFDMFLMADCDRHVIANSSYSWWGAFLSKKDPGPFYPSIWYGPEIPEYSTWRDILPSNWREVQC